MGTTHSIFDHDSGTWEQRLAEIVNTMREMSSQTDPQSMVRAYAARMRRFLPTDASISLSRRDLDPPRYRITRFSGWDGEVNPWRDGDKLPLLEAGLLGRLIYGDQPCIIDEIDVADDDPAAAFLAGQRSLLALPLYDKGVALNMVVLTRTEPNAFNREILPEQVWMSNLFGRATHNLVLSEELSRAYAAVDQELSAVEEIQKSLLPASLPDIPTLTLAAHYRTSRRAGGDYYDFFPLDSDRWGILIADASGHGTPAAVIMAVTHSIAHTHPGPPTPPGRLLAHVNRELAARYTADNGRFVTAFYGVYDSRARTLCYASAGHPGPRVKRCRDRRLETLDAVRGLPLGIVLDETYDDATIQLAPGDQMILYTDGITETQNSAGDMFGVERLDTVLNECGRQAGELIEAVVSAVEAFSGGRPPADDRTMLVAKVS